MMNGCICCTVRQDLVIVLKKLKARIEAGTLSLDGIIIETTGMADPAPVAQTFFVDDDIKSFARLDGIVTLVDAKHIEQHLDEEVSTLVKCCGVSSLITLTAAPARNPRALRTRLRNRSPLLTACWSTRQT